MTFPFFFFFFFFLIFLLSLFSFDSGSLESVLPPPLAALLLVAGVDGRAHALSACRWCLASGVAPDPRPGGPGSGCCRFRFAETAAGFGCFDGG
eukprot:COSAG06_NODE_15016_length_1105_cov_0.934394_1_plen_93_part_10